MPPLEYKKLNKITVESYINHNKKRIYGGFFNNINLAELNVIELRQKYFTHSKECCYA